MNDNQQTHALIRPQDPCLVLCLFLIGASLGGSGKAFAGSSSAPLTVSAIVIRSCRFSTSSLSAVSDASVSGNSSSSILDINCPYQSSSRRVLNSAARIDREIFSGSSQDKIKAQPQQIPAMTAGKRAGEQDVSAGGYADYVVLDVNF